jgi:riboflavin kinase/FMN adenylyltransferase
VRATASRSEIFRCALVGTVVRGRGLGRMVGAATANVALPAGSIPDYGSYAGLATLEGRTHPAVAHVGVRPSIGGTEPLLEVHLLGVDGDLYGATIEVVLLEKVAEEQALRSLRQLRRKIADDVRRVRAYFARCTGASFERQEEVLR